VSSNTPFELVSWVQSNGLRFSAETNKYELQIKNSAANVTKNKVSESEFEQTLWGVLTNMLSA